jgi:nucleotide-binding universal stress UspA family protein
MAQLSPTGRFERILLASDGSEYSAGAVRVALTFAARCGAQVTAATMVMTNPEFETIAPQRVQQAEDHAREHLAAIVAEAARMGVACEALLMHGEEPAREIVAAAERVRADVVVMGRRGKRGLARLMVGHATAKVVGRARCSVLVVPRVAQIWQRRILLGTDGSRFSDAAAIAAGKLAQQCGLPLTAVSVVRRSFSEARAAEAEEAVDRVREFLDRDGVAVDTLVKPGLPEEVIVETAAAQAADLIVLGSHGRTGLERILLGSVTERVIGAAQCPVLAVKA